MALIAHAAGVDGPHGPLLLPTSFSAPRGEVTFVAGDPGPAQTTLALALGGRVRLDHGEISYDGDADARVRRDRVCLVDVPTVTEPEPGLPVEVVVGEQLALAELPARRHDIRAFLAERGAEQQARARWDSLQPHQHVGWLAELGASRETVSAAVITSPDRWGGDPHRWWLVAEELAQHGLVVVVLATHNSARLLGLSEVAHEMGAAA